MRINLSGSERWKLSFKHTASLPTVLVCLRVLGCFSWLKLGFGCIMSSQKLDVQKFEWHQFLCSLVPSLVSRSHTHTVSHSLWQTQVWARQSVILTVADGCCDVWFTLRIWSCRYRGSEAYRDISSARSHSRSLRSAAELNKHTNRTCCALSVTRWSLRLFLSHVTKV